MKAFAELYRALDRSFSVSDKQAALQAYFRQAEAADAAWAVYFLAGGKPRQLAPSLRLRSLAQAASGLPAWLFDECYEAVGDLAETISLLLPAPQAAEDRSLADWMHAELLPLKTQTPQTQAESLLSQWNRVAGEDRLVYLKLITGSLRVGVSRLQATQALAAVAGIDAKVMAQRLIGYTHVGARPDADAYRALLSPPADNEESAVSGGHPFPFFLAHSLALPVEQFATALGDPDQWLVEWKWDGIRAQLIRRADQAWLWSRGEELIGEGFPELQAAATALPNGTTLDGEILVWRAPAGAQIAAPDPAEAGTAGLQPFGELQKRLGRKNPGAKRLKEQPAILMAYDLLQWQGEDWRQRPQEERRAQLERAIAAAAHPALRLSPRVVGVSWADLARQRQAARRLGTEGFMLKRRDARYGVGRTKDAGVWWKWKIDPMRVDAVLVYAQRGHGRRASLYSDYTFAVWSGPPEDAERTLVPFAKAYSGLSDAEMAQVDAIVRKTTRESFGPVKSVTPTLVFELGFEGIGPSARHKSGLAVRFPRMLRWRRDKAVEEADCLQALQAMLPENRS